MAERIVVALGGNALGSTPEKQLELVQNTAGVIADLVEQGYEVVIGHGNGPQVGMINLAMEFSANKGGGTPPMPFPECGAMTQGYIGYHLQQAIGRSLREKGIKKNCAAVITQIVVDPDDPGFLNPTKPIGPYYTEDEMNALKARNPQDSYAKDPKGKGWRKVVASPKPIEINNKDIVKDLAEKGNIVVTVGGGGIPVYVNDKGEYHGIDAVIDKDLASSLLAIQIGADEFYILTDVPKVCLNFHTPEEKQLDTITVEEAKKYLAEGHFTEGSMAPKIRAALYFVENGGKSCIITEAGQLGNPNAGTRIVK